MSEVVEGEAGSRWGAASSSRCACASASVLTKWASSWRLCALFRSRVALAFFVNFARLVTLCKTYPISDKRAVRADRAFELAASVWHAHNVELCGTQERTQCQFSASCPQHLVAVFVTLTPVHGDEICICWLCHFDY